MKLYLIPILFVLLSQTVFAQKVHISDPTNKCVISCYFEATPGHTINAALLKWSYTGTEKIGAYTYSKLGPVPFKAGTFYIREDTTAGIVYMSDDVNTEVLLYDYNWQAGDTIGYTSSGAAYVERIDTIQVNGFDHKVFRITDYPNNAYPQTIIEGFGNITYPFSKVSEHGGGYMPGTLICFKNANGTPTVVTSLQTQSAINLGLCKTLDVPAIDAENATVVIAPNPAHSSFTIQLPEVVTGELKLVNSIGQLVYARNIVNAQAIEVKDIALNAGVYYYHITGKASPGYQGKLVIE